MPATSGDQRASARISLPSDRCVDLPLSSCHTAIARNRARSWGRRSPDGRTLVPSGLPQLPTQPSVRRRRASNSARDDRAVPITSASPPNPTSPAITSANESPGMLTPSHPTLSTPKPTRCESAAHRSSRFRSWSGPDQRDPALASSHAGGQRELGRFSLISVRAPLTFHRHEAGLR
jgi:hypothetical protein